MIGWEEIGKTKLNPDTIAQHWWNKEVTAKAVAQGKKSLLSPAQTAYMDIKYHDHHPRLHWTGSTPSARRLRVGAAEMLG
jgi:hexosaminidase